MSRPDPMIRQTPDDVAAGVAAAAASGGDVAHLRRCVNQVADQLCRTVDGDFELQIRIDTADEDVQKLCMLVNFTLDNIRRRVSELEAMRQELRDTVDERTEQLRLVLDGANDGVWDWNIAQDRIVFSQRWYHMLGLAALDTPQAPDFWLRLVHPDDRRGAHTALRAHLEGITATFETELRMLHANGTYRWMLCRGMCARSDTGRPSRIAGTFTDITAARAIDRHTGLPNETFFQQRVTEFGDESASRNIQFVVLLASPDKIAEIADATEPETIGELMREIASRLSAVLPITATVARLPGVGFGVVTQLDDGPAADRAAEVAARARAAFAEPFRIDGLLTHLDPAIGYAVYAPGVPWPRVEELVNAARTAMRHARAVGGVKTAAYDEQMRESARRAISTERNLRVAIEQGWVVPHFQPIVALASETPVGFEALARIRREDGSWEPPSGFIPVAEETGLIAPLGEEILRQALQTFRPLIEIPGNGDLELSVNLSGRQLSHASLAARVSAILASSRVPARNLKLEVTETSIIADDRLAIRILSELRETGIKIAIDDFGTGYSSLSTLQRLPIQTLKIDRVFVRDVHTRTDRAAIVDMILALSATMQLDVVAEGIETDAEAEYLKTKACGFGQGYLYSRPLPPESLGRYLMSHQGIAAPCSRP